MSDTEDVFREADRSLLKTSLRTCLKRLNERQIDEFVEKMLDDGINQDTMSVVDPENLEKLGFDKYQAKAVAQHLKGGSVGSTSQAHQSNSNVLDTGAGPSGNQQATSNTAETLIGLSEFKINWELVYGQTYCGIKARDVIKKKETFSCSPQLRCNVANEIVRQAMNANISNLTRESFSTIFYEQILAKHKESFKTDLASGDKSSGGFLYILKYCFDNQKRPDRNRHLRSEDFLTRQYEQPRGKFAYACVKWRVQNDIPGQTDETVKEQQEKMKKDFYEIRPKFWDWGKLTDMMNNCFKAQREMINTNISDALKQQKKLLAKKRKHSTEDPNVNPDEDLDQEVNIVTISQISQEWPFLFSYQGMLIHFNTLTGIELEKELQNCKEGVKWEVILEFFKNLNKEDEFYSKTYKRMEKYQKKKPEEDNQFKAIILMIVKYFKEKNFVDLVDETVTMEILNERQAAPQYPTLTAPAKDDNLFRAKKFFIGVDAEYHFSFASFEKALCCIFMMYFVFNLDYDPETQITLEFLQRYVFNMDPPQGNKRPIKGKQQGKKKIKYSTKIIHDDVAKIITKLKEMERKKINENTQGDRSDVSSVSSSNHDDNEDE